MEDEINLNSIENIQDNNIGQPVENSLMGANDYYYDYQYYNQIISKEDTIIDNQQTIIYNQEQGILKFNEINNSLNVISYLICVLFIYLLIRNSLHKRR